MWPSCINQLNPFPYELKRETPKFLKMAFHATEIVDDAAIFIPVRPIKLLGKCSTARYLDCPNIPDGHVDLAYDYQEGRGNPDNYHIGQYYWFDFDILDSNMNTLLELRMVFNEGDGDCNDGLWGAVWERNTESKIADILSKSDTAIITAQPTLLTVEDQLQDIIIPSNSDFGEDNDPLVCPDIEFSNNLKIEEIIGMAIRWCCVFAYDWNYSEKGYDS
ncbi:hypothetical protein [[Leptolyngbya] sp. PCC 7376]|uniref:hypothetical protein n=1 Tax=[Leptolyngbya] sp. PCC 7376 TaxID=111781 RepID=UPI0006844EBB|nr:hypothetical protein [[Leptolyngbya] sp. PCC 7376]